MRDRQAKRTFITQLRLDEAHRTVAEQRTALARINGDLERRVEDQVAVIVQRALDVDALNAQLQHKVQERSAELARALSRLATSDESAVLQEGVVIGDRVKIIRRIGEGGMGAVYLGTDQLTGKLAAVKVMHGRGVADAGALQRFVSEAAAASSISHSGIIRTLHVDVTDDGRLYQIMEYVEGEPLDRAMAAHTFDAGSAARIGAAIADALAAAHAVGIVHRDIKPNNLVLCKTPPGVRILDFGISKRLGESSAAVTAANEMIGTPRYMSPEQIRSSATVGLATDIYSLGLVVFELVAAKSPYADAKTPAEFMLAHSVTDPVRLTSLMPDVPAAFAEIVARCLAKEPTARPPELAITLAAIADEHGTPRTESLTLQKRATSAVTTIAPTRVEGTSKAV